MKRERSINTRGADLTTMIGHQYGGVVVIAVIDAPAGQRGRYLACRCAMCGAPVAPRRAGALLTKPPTGCAECAAKLQRRTVDMSGAEYPAFTVLGRVGEPSGIRTMWKCICKACGAECVIEQRKLTTYTSCGCLADQARRIGIDIAKAAAVDGTSLLAIQPGRKINGNSSTGVRGVCKMCNGKYRAYINLRRKQHHVGVYDTLEDAAKARAEAEERLYKPIIDEHGDRREYDGGQ